MFTALLWIIRDDFTSPQPNDFIRNILVVLAAFSILGAFQVHRLFRSRLERAVQQRKAPLSHSEKVPADLVSLVIPALMIRWALIELGGFLGLVNFMLTGVFANTLPFVGAAILAMLISVPTDNLMRKILGLQGWR